MENLDLSASSPAKPHSLYLHIPYCSRICSYCAFNVHLADEKQQLQFVEALCQEIAFIASQRPSLPLASIYFGGGTPSLLTEGQITKIMRAIYDNFKLMPDIEIGIESNPNDITPAIANTWAQLGFNRVSIGMQSSHQETLKLFHREHDFQMVVHAVEILHRAHLTNINLDLIFGVPGQTLEQWQETLVAAINLSPLHLSLYGLELHGGTRLTRLIESGKLPEADEDIAVAMYELAQNLLSQNGFQQYEISNWCKAGYESGHNLQYWRNLPYLGLGPGSHGYAAEQRTIVRRLPARYIQALTAPIKKNLVFPRTPASSKVTKVSNDEQIAETIMMGLRLTQEGINRQRFYNRFGMDIVELKKTPLNNFVERGLLEITPEAVRLKPEGYLLSNYVLRDLI